MMNKLILTTAFLIFPFLVGAQKTVPISKDDVIAKVRESNNTLKMAQQDVLVSYFRYSLFCIHLILLW